MPAIPHTDQIMAHPRRHARGRPLRATIDADAPTATIGTILRQESARPGHAYRIAPVAPFPPPYGGRGCRFERSANILKGRGHGCLRLAGRMVIYTKDRRLPIERLGGAPAKVVYLANALPDETGSRSDSPLSQESKRSANKHSPLFLDMDGPHERDKGQAAVPTDCRHRCPGEGRREVCP
jgi:hypothetical protein